MGEYALLLFVVLIVGALGLKAIGNPVKQNADDARAWLEGDGPIRRSAAGGTEATASRGVEPNAVSQANEASESNRSSDGVSGGNGGVFGAASDENATALSDRDDLSMSASIGGGGADETASQQGVASQAVNARVAPSGDAPSGGEKPSTGLTGAEKVQLAVQVVAAIVPGGQTVGAAIGLVNGEQTVAGVLRTAASELGSKTVGRVRSGIEAGKALHDYWQGKGTLGNVALHTVGVIGGRNVAVAAERALRARDAANIGEQIYKDGGVSDQSARMIVVAGARARGGDDAARNAGAAVDVTKDVASNGITGKNTGDAAVLAVGMRKGAAAADKARSAIDVAGNVAENGVTRENARDAVGAVVKARKGAAAAENTRAAIDIASNVETNGLTRENVENAAVLAVKARKGDAAAGHVRSAIDVANDVSANDLNEHNASKAVVLAVKIRKGEEAARRTDAVLKAASNASKHHSNAHPHRPAEH